MAFTPEISLPTLQYFYSHYRTHIWTANGFLDSFNLTQQWYDTDELGIDQGPIVIMIENYRTQSVWRLFMQNSEIQRGLQLAGFVPLPFIALAVSAQPDQNTVTLSWSSQIGHTYQVEYSPDLVTWFASPTGEVTADGFHRQLDRQRAARHRLRAIRGDATILSRLPVWFALNHIEYQENFRSRNPKGLPVLIFKKCGAEFFRTSAPPMSGLLRQVMDNTAADRTCSSD